jgi:hypothetical protein
MLKKMGWVKIPEGYTRDLPVVARPPLNTFSPFYPYKEFWLRNQQWIGWS